MKFEEDLKAIVCGCVLNHGTEQWKVRRTVEDRTGGVLLTVLKLKFQYGRPSVSYDVPLKARNEVWLYTVPVLTADHQHDGDRLTILTGITSWEC